ncbi:hypothetical protein CMI47_06795 [Candidatus Pacearchaeota archaeon]|nr:hypothetical protein [Candidatus Pacearchaeota archaeon]|tara:strand:- start:355 stop:573 length:219 start_codon:yes stop_codon:yes gene_type:complete
MKNPVSDDPKKQEEEWSQFTDMVWNEIRTLRGGNWMNVVQSAKASKRDHGSPDSYNATVGFRVVRNKPKGKK